MDCGGLWDGIAGSDVYESDRDITSIDHSASATN
jgi:hypothetical protein